MPPDLSIQPADAPSPVLPKAAPPAASQTDTIAAKVADPPHASPVSLLDASTGLVVLAFYDAKGDETASLPTKKQLDLYRLNEPSPNIFEPAIRDVSVLPSHA